jgi:Protein of unknown function (DUF4058)
MPSPFPGMDPYLERPSIWPDVHNKFVSELQTALNSRLPPNYVARMELRVYVSDEGDPGRQVLVPDLRIERSSPAGNGESTGVGVAVEVAEPLEYFLQLEEEISEVFLTIVEPESKSLVAVIEVLSYTNKIRGSSGRKSFLEKKREVLATEAHWIEIDLLRKGERLPTSPLVVLSEYRVTVSRGNARKKARYWPIKLRQKLPVIGIPLKGKDVDVSVDLGSVLNVAYDNAAYNPSIDYRQPPVPPLRPDDTKWANGLLRKKGLR